MTEVYGQYKCPKCNQTMNLTQYDISRHVCINSQFDRDVYAQKIIDTIRNDEELHCYLGEDAYEDYCVDGYINLYNIVDLFNKKE